MKVELHAHTIRYSNCAVLTPSELIQSLIKNRYGAVYITEHDAIWPEDDLEFLRREFPQIHIFGGLERSIGDGMHLVILGADDPIYLEQRDAEEILQTARQRGHTTILAHPFRWKGSDQMLNEGYLPDAMEFRTCNHTAPMAQKAMAFARQAELSLVNAGDIHSADMIGQFWIETDADLSEATDIGPIIQDGDYHNCQAC